MSVDFIEKLKTIRRYCIVKENIKTKARDFVILFSSDLDLEYRKLIDYYKLRFQIEFNFRDAKQYWGLEDFMNIKEIPLTNAVNLAFFMVNLSNILINYVRPAVGQNSSIPSIQKMKTHRLCILFKSNGEPCINKTL